MRWRRASQALPQSSSCNILFILSKNRAEELRQRLRTPSSTISSPSLPYDYDTTCPTTLLSTAPFSNLVSGSAWLINATFSTGTAEG